MGLESLVGIEGEGEGGTEDVPQLKVHFGGEAIRARALAALECSGGNVELVGGEGGVAVCGGGSGDGGVEGGEELILCDAWRWAFREVLGEVGGYDLLCAAEAFVAVDVDGGGGVGVEDRGEAGVAVMARVAAGVEVVSGLLEEHEFERLRPLQIPLAEAAAVGCQCGCGGTVGCHGGGAGGVCACLRQLCSGKADGALQPVAVGADALAVGSMAVVGEDADAGDDVLKEAWGVGVFVLCLEARAVWGGGWLELAEEGGRVLSCILVVESVGLEAIHRGLQVVDEVLVGEQWEWEAPRRTRPHRSPWDRECKGDSSVVARQAVDDAGGGGMLQEAGGYEPAVEAGGAVGSGKCEVVAWGRVQVAPGVREICRSRHPLQRRSSDPAAGGGTGCGDGVVSGVDAVEVAAEEDSAVVGGHVSHKGGEEVGSVLAFTGCVGGDDAVWLVVECEVDAESAAGWVVGADPLRLAAAARLLDEDGHSGSGESVGSGATLPEGPAWPRLARRRPRVCPLLASVGDALVRLLQAHDVVGPVDEAGKELSPLLGVGESIDVEWEQA